MVSPTTQVARKGFSEPPVLYRQPLRIWGSGDFAGDQWRFLVGQAPIVRACVTTIIMYLQAREWYLQGDDQGDIAYYTKLLETADEGKGWNIWTARLEDDCMTMPFGGAAEIGAQRDGTVVWVAHLDAATMRPTMLADFPYGQMDPWGAREPVPFREDQVGRIMWMPETRLKLYEWSRTPAADCIPAITALVRADRFWQSLLLDTPPAGILDLMDMTEQEASDWYESWKKLLSGQDGFKIPVLYGGQDRKQPAQFIRFNSSPVELSMMDVIKHYAEQVCACFGLTLGDLGIFGQEVRLAGAAKMIELTKRQGPANMARALKAMIDNDILPDGVEFHWRDIDTEDSLRKAQGRMQSATALATVTQAGLVPERLAQLAAEALDIVPQEAIDQYNAEQTGQGDVAVADAPLDSLPTGNQDGTPAAQKAGPPRSKWAKKMKGAADRLLAPSRQGFTKARIKGLIEAGVKAYGDHKSRGYQEGPDEPILPEGDSRRDWVVHERSRQSAEDALAKRLAKESWWKAPNLVNDVFSILTGAYEDGIRDSIKAAGGKVKPATVNLTNKDVLAELETHAGEFITQIDDGTQNIIVRHIMAGVELGRSSPDISDAIIADVRTTLLDRWKGRVDSIVNTEINTAETRAALRSYQEIGLETKRWVAVPGLACEICLGNADQGDVPMDYQFETVFGEADGPPGHPTVCHCYASFSKSELKALGEDPNWWLGS